MATVHDTYQGDSYPRSDSGMSLANIALWVLFGGIAGWVASLIMGNDAGLGVIGNVGVGVAGAFVGGFIADRIGMGGAPGAERPTSLMSFAWAVIGAVILLFLLNLLM